MEDFLVSVLKIMDRKLSKQLNRLESIIQKNNEEFKECLSETQKLRKSIVEYNESENEDMSLSHQIGFMIKVFGNDPQLESLEGFDISKVISEDQNLSKLELEVYFELI